MKLYNDCMFPVDFEFDGDIFKKIRFSTGDLVLITTKPSVNKGVNVLTVYVNSKRVYGMRARVESIDKFLIDDLLKDIYWTHL